MSKIKPWERHNKSRFFKPYREIKQRFFIICEGKTEKNYFDRFKLLSAKVKALDKKGKNATSLITEALIEKALNKDYDQYWLVFDRDDQTNTYDQIIEVFNKAKSNGLKLAFCNQCFELWYLLHFQEVSAAMSYNQLEQKLDKLLPEDKTGKYEKNDTSHYEQLLPYQEGAIHRSRKLNYNLDVCTLAKINPSLTVNILVEEFIKYK